MPEQAHISRWMSISSIHVKYLGRRYISATSFLGGLISLGVTLISVKSASVLSSSVKSI